MSLYADPSHYDLLAQSTAPADLPFYRRHARGPLLELGCGTGRLTLPLSESLAGVEGLDVAEPLLAGARKKAGAERIRWHRADMRSFQLPSRFATVIIPYNTFNHLLGIDDVLSCLAAVAKHLERRGQLIIDTFHPDPRRLLVTGGPEERIVRYRLPDRRTVSLYESNHYDGATQINQIRWRHALEDDPEWRIDELRMRIFFPCELEALFRLAGWKLQTRLGDYDGRPFGPRATKQLCILEPR